MPLLYCKRRMSVRKLYPQGKAKAFQLTYDDGVLQDVPLVQLLNRYGIKATFNLNSQLMAEGFAWTHPNGMQVVRLSPEAAKGLYDGHEIASHTLTHPYMQDLSREELLWQMGQDRENLQKLFGREVLGFAVPFHYYDQQIADCAREVGFAYARTSDLTFGYTPCRAWYHWKTGMYHVLPEFGAYVEGFFASDEELALCQIVGHSYDLDAENLWDTLEGICQRVAAREDIWCCTHLELVRYLQAMEAFDGSNRSDQTLWFSVDGHEQALAPGETL